MGDGGGRDEWHRGQQIDHGGGVRIAPPAGDSCACREPRTLEVLQQLAGVGGLGGHRAEEVDHPGVARLCRADPYCGRLIRGKWPITLHRKSATLTLKLQHHTGIRDPKCATKCCKSLLSSSGIDNPVEHDAAGVGHPGTPRLPPMILAIGDPRRPRIHESSQLLV
jgi:hypothetical protein